MLESPTKPESNIIGEDMGGLAKFGCIQLYIPGKKLMIILFELWNLHMPPKTCLWDFPRLLNSPPPLQYTHNRN